MLGKNSEENLEKDSPYVLLVFPGDEGLHSISPQVFVKLVHVQEGLVRFPGIAGFAEASPAKFELHGRSLVAIAAVADDRLNDELLLIMLRPSTETFGQCHN